MEENLVRYSRAGDAFHYRWAARRCLQLIYPNTSLTSVVIEGSKENLKAGEYVIDVSEYQEDDEGQKTITYYQLKHSSVRADDAIKLSGLKGTIEGFSQRFKQHLIASDSATTLSVLITNRLVAQDVKQNIKNIVEEKKCDKRFYKTIQKYTGLKDEDLIRFLKSFQINDREGNYEAQRRELHVEIAQLLVGAVANSQIDSIISLVTEKALPKSNGIISKEEILLRFGITSERDLYPAPPIFEKAENIIVRDDYVTLKNTILTNSETTIIHASGGVGKSVFARYVPNNLAVGSLGVVYDCFGGGQYRNRSATRHRHTDALVQIANELAARGLCNPLLPQLNNTEEDTMRKFLVCLQSALSSLRKLEPTALLVILIDAADNAEMAAAEYNQTCFASELLREKMPDGCRLVMLCRTERVSLLKPQSSIKQLELGGFSIDESHRFLRRYYEVATYENAVEFQRLTNGNPRVQANFLDIRYPTVSDFLFSVGPGKTTVSDQIGAQLERAMAKLYDHAGENMNTGLKALCTGLATLPPLIPIEVLSKASGVEASLIRSFVADIGRPLWLSDTAVQFRDEPTETWFRKAYAANTAQINHFITVLEPHSYSSAYIAEALPQLYSQAGRHQELIDLALTDQYLPSDNPLDTRSVRLYRLQFAFKAALKLNRFEDSAKLALRSGEEVAGNNRQIDLFKSNIDLLTPLQGEAKATELAFKKVIRSAWNGSADIFSAALLSTTKNYEGESRAFLRSADNWLKIYLSELEDSEDVYEPNLVQETDILELAFCRLNILGPEGCIHFLSRIRPRKFVSGIFQALTSRLIDHGRFEDIDKLLVLSVRSTPFVFAITSELVRIGRFPEEAVLDRCLTMMLRMPRNKIRKRKPVENYGTEAIASFAEACAFRGINKGKILHFLAQNVSARPKHSIYSQYHRNAGSVFLRIAALRLYLSGADKIDVEALLPEENLKNPARKDTRDRDNDKQVVGAMIPWCYCRVKLMIEVVGDKEVFFKQADEESRTVMNGRHKLHDFLPAEISSIIVSSLIVSNRCDESLCLQLYEKYIKDRNTIYLNERIELVRASVRNTHLKEICLSAETIVRKMISPSVDDDPETTSNRYCSLARAVLSASATDATVYFESAVNAVSKFGDELVRRWQSSVDLSKKASESLEMDNVLAYRFLRTAELVGESVDREKYWNRNEAISCGLELSATGTIATLSRWRDRRIGNFGSQLASALNELVIRRTITPSVGWSLAALLNNGQMTEVGIKCISSETNYKLKQIFFNELVNYLMKEGDISAKILELEKLAKDEGIDAVLLSEASEIIRESIISNEIKEGFYKPQTKLGDDDIKWHELFYGIDMHTSVGLTTAYASYQTSIRGGSHNNYLFWQEVILRIERHKAVSFLNALLASDLMGIFEFEDVLARVPVQWTQTISFEDNWPKIIRLTGQKFARALSRGDMFSHFVKKVNINDLLQDELCKGIITGIASGNEFNDAEVFFGFVGIVSRHLSSSQANNLLGYSLDRFELHIDEEFGDGPWSSWLHTPKDIHKAISGLIWSALGAPEAETRWRAAHVVKRLGNLRCEIELKELLEWEKKGMVGPFGSNLYTFYQMHATQYLFISLSRVVIDHPKLLIPYKEYFVNTALTSTQVLIIKFATDVVLALEKKFPDAFTAESIAKLRSIHSQNLLAANINDGSLFLEESEEEAEYYFGWDITNYWLRPLGNVFGVSAAKVGSQITNVLRKEWGVNRKPGYTNDERVALWDRNGRDQETSHDHGSYPLTDNLDFYWTYHGMLVAAWQLFNTAPVIDGEDWEGDAWTSWLDRHLLSREDGKWLADRRDSVPLRQSQWIIAKDVEVPTAKESDYLQSLLFEYQEQTWLNIDGGWTNRNSDKSEILSFNSALVNPGTSNSLMSALSTCLNPHNFKLPDYDEEYHEIDFDNFQLSGWILKGYSKGGLDKFDPFAGELEHPPLKFGKSVAMELNLTADDESRFWFEKVKSSPVAYSRIWASAKPYADSLPNQIGSCLSTSVEWLMKACAILNKDIILEVSLERKLNWESRSHDETYSPKPHAIFIFSKDGKLRSSEKNYQLG